MPFSVDLKSNPNHRCSKYPDNISQAGVIALLLPIAIPFNSIWAVESQPVDASAPVLHPPSQRVVHPPFPLPILPFSPILPSHSLYPPLPPIFSLSSLPFVSSFLPFCSPLSFLSLYSHFLYPLPPFLYNAYVFTFLYTLMVWREDERNIGRPQLQRWYLSQAHKQRLCKIIITRVKVHFMDLF